MALTPRQDRFVEEYLVDSNATQAAIRAGYAASGAEVQGHRLLSNAKVRDAILGEQVARSKRTAITADKVLRELARIGFSSLADVTDWGVREVAFGYDADGKKLPAEDIGDAALVRYVDAPFVVPVNRNDLPADVRAAVSEVALTKDGFRIKMHDKARALQLIGQHLGMFVEKRELSGPGGGPIQVEPMVDVLSRFSPEEREQLRGLLQKIEGE
jgi:phage terminase small subunit